MNNLLIILIDMTNGNIIKVSSGKQKVRILRPWEVRQLVDAIPKTDYQLIFKTLLFTGARYIEIARFQKHLEWLDGQFIELPSELASRKAKRKQKERWIRLNPRGQEVVQAFKGVKTPLPSYINWTMALKRWAEKAGIDSSYLGPKTTRKTWESWLVFCFEEKLIRILTSQGHDKTTAINHYINLPFTDDDKKEMLQFVGGWV